MGQAREDELLRVAARFNASLNLVPHVYSLVVEKKSWPADFLRRQLCSGSPVIKKHMNYAAGLEVVLEVSQKNFC